jgi:hypothetical protein
MERRLLRVLSMASILNGLGPVSSGVDYIFELEDWRSRETSRQLDAMRGYR